MHYSRREFVQRAGGLAAVGLGIEACVASAADPAAADPPIIDTHQHLWDLERVRPPWLRPGDLLNRSYVLADYGEAVRGLGVEQAVYMEVDVDPAQHNAEADYVLDLCRRPETVTKAAVIGGRPAGEGFRQYILRFKGSPYVKGIREIFKPQVNDKPLAESDALAAGLRLLGELGMSFDLCLPPKLLGEAARLVARCPETRFILDHCGNADPEAFMPTARRDPARPPAHDADAWRRDIEALAQRKNVVCKISGIVARVRKDQWTPDDLAPIVRHCLDSFGPDRAMFASDWPVCLRGATLRQWVEALRTIVADHSPADRRKLFGENARAFYALKP